MTRRTTVLFVVLAMVVQSLAVFSPPEAANASSEQDIIRGGVSSLEDFLIRYDHNEDDVKDIYSTAGVSRSEIVAAKPGTITAEDTMYVMNRYGQLSSSRNEVAMQYPKSTGGMGVRYFSPLSSISGKGSHFQGWVGNSESLGWFAIIRSSGSLVTRELPSSISSVTSTSGTGLSKTIRAQNLSQPSSEEDSPAKPRDKISYTLEQSNSSASPVSVEFSVRLTDVLEYATLFDSGGGDFNTTTKTLAWPAVELAPGESQQRAFIVQVASEIPATGVGKSNPASFDCKLALAFGNVVETPVDCPVIKSIEGILRQLPPASTGITIGFSVILLVIVLFFYARTRQLRKEIRIIRHNFNTGII